MKTIFLSFALSILISFSLFAQNTLASVELEAQNVKSVKIRGSFCDVVVAPGSTTYLKGVIRGSGDPDDYEIFTEIRGDELFVEVDKKGGSWNRLDESLIELTLREGVTVNVRNSSGDIQAENLNGDKFIFEATSGDIELEDIVADLKVGSTSGDLELENIKGRLDLETTSGDQEIEGSEGDIFFESTSGDVSFTGFNGDIEGRVTSGDITLYDGKGALSLKSTSGEIEGNGISITGDCNFRSSSGDIDFEFTNSLDEFSFDLEASSGSLRVGNRSGDDSIYIKEGSIWIQGISSSGSQSYTRD